jgi:hypothetical protein
MCHLLTLGPLSIQCAAARSQASDRYIPAKKIGELFFIFQQLICLWMTRSFGYADFPTHLADVVEVLKRLLSVGMQVNPDKRMWFWKKSVTLAS